MSNLDMILYIFEFAAAVILALLTFYTGGLLFIWLRNRKQKKKMYPHGTPWYWRTKDE